MVIDFAAARAQLIRHLSKEVKDTRVLDAMSRVPREQFVPLSQQRAAYEDKPLPIGHGQTISQPLIVAMMIEAMHLEGGERVLEVGTGSGYQAAILGELAEWVVSVERVRDLAVRAKQVLERLGYRNVEIHLAERGLGWPQGAPYDAIIVAAGAPEVPQALLDQARSGGCLVIPVGSRYEQRLLKVTRDANRASVQDLGPCRWVPLIGEGAWDE